MNNDDAELLPVWLAAGFDSGNCQSKVKIHLQGIWHPTVQIWLCKRSLEGRQYLLQLRSAEKDSFPSCWDVSVAGHVRAGESLEKAALRELKEELGIRLEFTNLQFLFRMPYYGHYDNGLSDCEWQHVYLAELAPDWNDSAFQLQEGEVSTLRWVSWAELERDWAYFANRHGIAELELEEWQGFTVQGFALHRHYPIEANTAGQAMPKPLLSSNHYWAKLQKALKDDIRFFELPESSSWMCW